MPEGTPETTEKTPDKTLKYKSGDVRFFFNENEPSQNPEIKWSCTPCNFDLMTLRGEKGPDRNTELKFTEGVVLKLTCPKCKEDRVFDLPNIKKYLGTDETKSQEAKSNESNPNV